MNSAEPPSMLGWNPRAVNLPHAATVAGRMLRFLTHQAQPSDERHQARDLALEIFELLHSCEDGDSLSCDQARRLCEQTAGLGRGLVDSIEAHGLGADRLGQQVRNLFECLGLAAEGAELSLRAGEDPHSLMRPL